jgi:hypothetical protein
VIDLHLHTRSTLLAAGLTAQRADRVRRGNLIERIAVSGPEALKPYHPDHDEATT